MSDSTLRVMPEKVVQITPSDDNVVPEASDSFVDTPYIQDLMKRACAYLAVGIPFILLVLPGLEKRLLPSMSRHSLRDRFR